MFRFLLQEVDISKKNKRQKNVFFMLKYNFQPNEGQNNNNNPNNPKLILPTYVIVINYCFFINENKKRKHY